MTLTHTDFATEVRSDRLRLLARTTWIGSTALALLLILISSMTRWPILPMVLLGMWISFGCGGSLLLLHSNRYAAAVWTFALGAIIGVYSLALSSSGDVMRLAPLALPLLIVTAGLMLSSLGTVILTALTTVLVLVGGWVMTGQPAAGEPAHWMAILLGWLGAGLAAQVSGELYQITEWALLNYQRERRTSEALFDNRQQLEKALLRSQSLSENLTEANIQLEAAKNFRGQFLANMSHELRTPLNAIIGFSETMIRYPQMYDGIPLPPIYQQDLGEIYNSGRQLLNLINDILDLSKVDAGKLELHLHRVPLEPITEAVLHITTGLLGGKAIEMRRDYCNPLPEVLADDTRLRQVLLNLLGNAVKFTESGSITLQIRPEDGGVRLSVIDTGQGIDPALHESIFEEFKQVNSIGRDPRAGAGLGLAISRHLVALMHGRIWLESEAGKGSRFHIWLPAAE
ncbi:MAG TPA: HAMP domain-containing sensor histidine kinase [Aggregatilineales bacterium]|nr:HAMP domain-containing sensor histidine kinase [Aggregatilineales bacterium]